MEEASSPQLHACEISSLSEGLLNLNLLLLQIKKMYLELYDLKYKLCGMDSLIIEDLEGSLKEYGPSPRSSC